MQARHAQHVFKMTTYPKRLHCAFQKFQPLNHPLNHTVSPLSTLYLNSLRLMYPSKHICLTYLYDVLLLPALMMLSVYLLT